MLVIARAAGGWLSRGKLGWGVPRPFPLRGWGALGDFRRFGIFTGPREGSLGYVCGWGSGAPEFLGRWLGP